MDTDFTAAVTVITDCDHCVSSTALMVVTDGLGHFRCTDCEREWLSHIIEPGRNP